MYIYMCVCATCFVNSIILSRPSSYIATYTVYYVCVCVFEGPTVPRALTVVRVTDAMVTLSWMPPVPPNGIITQYQVEYRSNSSGFELLQPTNVNLTRTITGLSSNTQYIFRIIAFTMEGNGPASSTADAHTST